MFQVEEISGLTQHLLQDCTSKDKFYKCPKCSEAIDKQDVHDCVNSKYIHIERFIEGTSSESQCSFHCAHMQMTMLCHSREHL